MRKPPTVKATQSLCVSTQELETIRAAARAQGISVSSFGYSRIMAALASKATRLGALRDLSTLEAGPVTAKGRKCRASVIMAAPDYVALKSVAEHAGVSAHALAQAIVITDAERLLSRAGARGLGGDAGGEPGPAPSLAGEAAPVTLVPIDHSLAPEHVDALAGPVARMVRGLGAALWPDRHADVGGTPQAYEKALERRRHVRAGMVRVLANHPRDPDREQTVPVAIDPQDVLWMAAALAMSVADVARAIALRCLLDARRDVVASEVDALVADALRPVAD